MLRILRIRNFAIIDRLELEFASGFNVITGETGAGKSIILDAVGLILGSRAQSDLIRAGSDEAVVEALFDVSQNETLIRKLEAKGLNMEQAAGELLIKRSLHKTGKGRIFLNGELTTLSQLHDISEYLLDLCSQHEHQSLAKHSYQLDLIDRYGGLLDKRRELREIHSAFRSKQSELMQLTGDSSDPHRIEDFLRFQLNEIQIFAPQPQEEESLTQERKRLLSSTHLLDICSSASSSLGGGNNGEMGSSFGGAHTLINKALKKISKGQEIDATLYKAAEPLQRALLEVEDALSHIDAYSQALQVDPERQEYIEERLSKWSNIKRKYGSSYHAILETQTRLETELNEILGRQTQVETLTLELQSIRQSYLTCAKTLSKQRKNVVKSLIKSIQNELNELKMPGTAFEVTVECDESESHWTAEGIDRVQFLFAPNVGEGLKPIAKIASGGELSRVMLSIRRVIADRGGIGVYLFDEIDAGIGGQTATVVGRKLKSVANFNQVICITHLPQIAAYASSHFSVVKRVDAGRTFSEITHLSDSSRVEEISRMLGGLDVTGKSRAHAKELIKQATL